MRKIEISPGDKIGDLEILSIADKSSHGDMRYVCRCKCGNMCIRKATVLKFVMRRGSVNSCGCRKNWRLTNAEKKAIHHA